MFAPGLAHRSEFERRLGALRVEPRGERFKVFPVAVARRMSPSSQIPREKKKKKKKKKKKTIQRSCMLDLKRATKAHAVLQLGVDASALPHLGSTQIAMLALDLESFSSTLAHVEWAKVMFFRWYWTKSRHHLRNPGRMIPLQIPTNIFSHGFQVLQDSIHPQYVRAKSLRLQIEPKGQPLGLGSEGLRKLSPSHMAMGQNPVPPVNIPNRLKWVVHLSQNGIPLVLNHGHMLKRRF